MSDVDSDARRLATGVKKSDALLPEPPGLWSFSSLKDIEACPRRYMLLRASYPDLGYQDGYPQLPSLPALMGVIVHDTLEEIVKELVAAGCESSSAEGVTGVMIKLGGITAVVDRVLAKKLKDLECNPRLNEEQLRRLARDLADGVADARVRVQEYLSRGKFAPRPVKSGVAVNVASHEPRLALRCRASLGANAEVTVMSEELCLMGRIDLLNLHEDHATILDYKTGVENPSHIEQLQMYALLWDLDRVVNPDSIPTVELIAAYPHRDLTMPAPTPEELLELAQVVRQRTATANSVFTSNAPQAKPSAENCGVCQVRQLCADYWTSTELTAPPDVEVGDWFDFEGLVGPANGIRSVWLLDSKGEKKILLRTTPTSPLLVQGEMVRLLGLRRDLEPDTPNPVAVMSTRSEVFVLANSN